ncbi:beta-glucosidase [Saccharicrinis sp. FJH54]|uniref:beta-glucosidase n=1 Tax=Saccharicrinis sp. FJH54 TaxID=3344665 RepID=UPI0035D4FCCB
MNRTLFLILTAFFFTGIMHAQSSTAMDKEIESILSKLTLKEKVAMCHAQSKFSTPGVERLGIPEVWMSDGPHGVRAEINWDDWGYAGWTNDSITAFPALTCLAATFNPELSGEYGFAVGEEARYRKKDVLLGPGVNIYRTPMNGRNFEYMGEDPFLASTMVVPYIQGVQKSGVAACVKHYALNNQEEWRGHINVKVSDRALHEIYLPAFKAAVTKGEAWALMGAYNKYNEQHCCHNEILLNKILKKDWGFDGVVVSDWSGAHNTMESALYGLDMEMGTMTNGMTDSEEYAYDHYYLASPFYALLKEGKIDESVVDDKVRRILRLMLRTNMNANRPAGNKNTKAHQDAARKIATDGIVLLKNKDNFFPLNPETTMTIAVIGENATKSMTIGGGSSELKAQYEISPLLGIKNRFKNATIIHAMGYASGPSAYGRVVPSKLDADSLFKAAVKAAASADMVLFIGGLNKNHHQDCEGGDRLTFGLPFGQEELITEISKVNPNIGLVLVSGNAVAMPWLNKVKAVLQSWYLGSEAGNAIAEVISGDVNPSGKLPFTFPVKLEDNAAHHFGELSYPGNNVDVVYEEGILVGYRWHDTKKIKPQFAFGYGLSYTGFDLNNIKTDKKTYSADDKIRVSCEVKNSGSRDGAEVIQVYIGKPGSEVTRALKELKGFKKVYVKAGKSEQVLVELNVNDLAYYNESAADWSLEKGNYIVYVGNASDNIAQKLKIKID